MQFKFKTLLLALVSMTIFACQCGKKQSVDANVVNEMQTFAEQAKAIQPKIDAVKTKVNAIAGKYMLNPANIAPEGTMIGGGSEGSMMLGTIGQRYIAMQQQYKDAMDNYNRLLGQYKNGEAMTEFVAEQKAALEHEIRSLEEAAESTIPALDVVEEKIKSAPPAPMKGAAGTN